MEQPRSRLELAARPPTPLADSLARLETLVSPYTGVVRGAEEVLAAADDVRAPSVFCQTGRCAAVVGAGDEHRGAGAGPTIEAARAAAIGEAVERYSACFTESAGTLVATARRLGRRAVDPRRFALFAPEQYACRGFAYEPFTPDTQVSWVRGWHLPDGAPAYLPAQLVYLGWRLDPRESCIARSTSNGLACHATFEEATVAGLLELVERDAFMITWAARLSWPLLTWHDDAGLAEFEGRCIAPTGLRASAVDLSAVWGIPVVVGVARSELRGEAPLGVGAGAAPTVQRAVEKALDEAVRVRSWARSIRYDDPAGSSVPPASEIREFDDHIRHYAYDDNAANASFLDASDDRRDVAQVPRLDGITVRDHLYAICERLERHGASAYVVDVTAPDVADAGLCVAKVVAPELCALDVEHAARLLGGRRLYETPARLGVAAQRLRFADVNPHPHPFP
jgi:ribosomal protein S12 methylthiotransferase accessory factor